MESNKLNEQEIIDTMGMYYEIFSVIDKYKEIKPTEKLMKILHSDYNNLKMQYTEIQKQRNK